MNLNVYLEVLIALVITYVVLICATYLYYRRPVSFNGYYFPANIQIEYLLTAGPMIVILIGFLFALIGAVLLSPFIFFYFELKWLALISLIALAILAHYSPISLNGKTINLVFPFNILIGMNIYMLIGIAFGILGALFLTPIIFLIFV